MLHTRVAAICQCDLVVYYCPSVFDRSLVLKRVALAATTREVAAMATRHRDVLHESLQQQWRFPTARHAAQKCVLWICAPTQRAPCLCVVLRVMANDCPPLQRQSVFQPTATLPTSNR
eukprot:18122-Heterococcus_DN1.PRE.1